MERIKRAKEFLGLSGGAETCFWEGYTRGLRRYYHGMRFGTVLEHMTWLNSRNYPEEDWRYRGIGYKVGYDSMPISVAVEVLSALGERRKNASLHEMFESSMRDKTG